MISDVKAYCAVCVGECKKCVLYKLAAEMNKQKPVLTAVFDEEAWELVRNIMRGLKTRIERRTK